MEFFNDIGGDPHKPSLFELVAQEQLRDLLQPALKYVLVVFAQRYPRYLVRVVNRHEEFYAALMFFVERHYLRKHDASFAENFYGLKRRRRPWIEPVRVQAAIGGISPGEKLRSNERWLSLLFLVGVPYLRAKAYDYYEALGGRLDGGSLNNADTRNLHTPSSQSFGDRFRKMFTVVYPWLNTSFETWLFLYNVAYLFERTPFFRPWLAWTGVDLRRLGPDDFRLGLPKPNRVPVRGRVSILSRLQDLLFLSPQLVLDSLRFLLPTAIFFVRFLEWWYSPNSPARSFASSQAGPIVLPPRLLPPHPKGIPIDGTAYGQCPLCRHQINNATALPSGYVFCYRCAYDQVDKHARCPVTLLPAKVWQMRKVLV